MPINPYFQAAAFDAKATAQMGGAFEAALQVTGIENRTEAMAELIAHKIMQVYRLGEHDPIKLCERALNELGVPWCDPMSDASPPRDSQP